MPEDSTSILPLTIETERLFLRDFTPGDFEAFYATTTDPEYRRFYAEAEMSQAFWQEIFASILAGARATPRAIFQLAICTPAGTMMGTCGIRIERPDDQQASFGCAIARPYWGHGYALEASRHIIDFAFTSLPIHRIYAETIGANARARALAERLGMRLEGELREHKFFRGRWWNTAIYAVLRDEWNRRRQQTGESQGD